MKKIPELRQPAILGLVDGALDPDSVPNGAQVSVFYDDMLRDDQVELRWITSSPAASFVEARAVQADGPPLNFTVPYLVLDAGRGLTATVDYIAVRTSTARQSYAQTIAILEAAGGRLDLNVVTSDATAYVAPCSDGLVSAGGQRHHHTGISEDFESFAERSYQRIELSALSIHSLYSSILQIKIAPSDLEPDIINKAVYNLPGGAANNIILTCKHPLQMLAFSIREGSPGKYFTLKCRFENGGLDKTTVLDGRILVNDNQQRRIVSVEIGRDTTDGIYLDNFYWEG